MYFKFLQSHDNTQNGRYVHMAKFDGTLRAIYHFRASVEQNGRHFADDIFKCIFVTENVDICFKSP